VEKNDPFHSLLPSELQFLQPFTPAKSTPRLAIRGFLGSSSTPLSPMEYLQQGFSEIHEAEEVAKQAWTKKTNQTKGKRKHRGAGASRPVAATPTTRAGRQTIEPQSFHDFIGGQ
jgi:hypothetical protein